MRNRNLWLAIIGLLAVFALWVDFSETQIAIDFLGIRREIRTVLGLDLQGGIQILLEADVPPNQPVDRGNLEDTRRIIENRVNALGVSEPVVQIAGTRRIVVELPGITNLEQAVNTIKQTGLLEFVDAGAAPIPEGATVRTSLDVSPTETVPLTGTPTLTPAPALTETAPITGTGPVSPTERVYRTVMTGRNLRSARPELDEFRQPQVAFTLDAEGTRLFAEYTSQNVGRYLCIVLDKKVISCPVIQEPITQGQGVIRMGSGSTLADAEALAVTLRYGALPVPLKIVDTRNIGPTLGRESIQRSLIAGIVGFATVALFMVLYYRVPGVLAVLALSLYAALVFAVFKLLPVTLTLPGIAGFVLSIGMAVDANILIFERLKEELRAGRNLALAIDYGFERAWPSIRDSNISTLITCVILYVFGLNFGASMVRGFALTLAIGVAASLFTGIWVTRAFLHVLLDRFSAQAPGRWFGI
ncbi:protein translocase subunit SecD [Thermoflexus sp.]|uniref:protein translocase subunit SecD n=1 Tax=Thermoflexus sp. TaxID=1969742 RepID=UPI0025CBC3A4|nr:protein translocase subunit SecD [Thermoflexus sp.]MCS6964453.1 protein translocase subunit SecD [Thermoflexus sp.]MCX7689279.1 protein translocase subunit SecD [Thermoflexus sp.]MDW8185074.1 protein translocase subunit SecD [Anaerolineae bacterium]